MAYEDKFEGMKNTLEMSSNHFYTITPDDSNDQPFITRAIYIGGSGDLSVIDEVGNTTTFVGVVQGTILPIRTARVRTTGTTASGLVALI